MAIKRNIALVVAYNGYQSQEYLIPKKILEAAGFTIITASNKSGVATASDGSTTPVDSTVDSLSIDTLAGLFFIGGPGAMENVDNNSSYQKIQEAALQSLPLGAICIAPRILAKAGALVAIEATGWNNDGKLEEIFREHGALYNESDVITDDNRITASGPEAAEDFALAILEIV